MFSPFLIMANDIYLSSSSSTKLTISIWSLVFSVFTFRVYLISVKAVVLILKHATLSRHTNLPESALTNAELDYQKANIDAAIQQHIEASAPEHSIEQFVGFIMGTDICLFILPSITSISYHPVSASTNTELLKHILKPNLMKSFFADSWRILQEGQVGPMLGDPMVSIVKPCTIMWTSKFWWLNYVHLFGFSAFSARLSAFSLLGKVMT